MPTDQQLQRVIQAAEAAGLDASLEGTSYLVFYPKFTGALGAYTGDIAVQVRPTPVGLRYCVYEEYAGFALAPGWEHELAIFLFGNHKALALRNAYWWTFRHWWGWLSTRAWRGLEEASSTANNCALRFHEECLRHEQGAKTDG
jgi:hypothetical protein